MARSVSALFEHQAQVDGVVGALRNAGIESSQISVVSPDSQQATAPTTLPAEVHTRHGVGAWLLDHLIHRGVPHDHAQHLHDQVAEGRRLVTIVVNSDAQNDDARNLLVRAGALQISNASDGKMVDVWRSGEEL
jgi:hypothetical protein